MNDEDVYQTLVSHATAAENISWSRFNNFLLFNSILILAWVTLYTQPSHPEQYALLLSVLSALGIVSGHFWAGLGLRGRNNVSKFLAIGKNIESKLGAWNEKGPFSNAIQLRDSGPFALCGSIYILTFGPFVSSILHIILLYLSLSAYASLQKLLTLVSVASVFIFACLAAWRIHKSRVAERQKERANQSNGNLEMKSTRRPISFWVIIVFLIVSMVLLLMGQTMAIFNYEFAVRLGLQEDVKEVSEFGVQINRAFGAGDTFVYIPLMFISLFGLFLKKSWSLVITAAVMGISAYWATTVAFMLIFLRGVPNYNLVPGPEYWLFIGVYIIIGVWGVVYLVFRGDAIIS
jgi:hypothetical protein